MKITINRTWVLDFLKVVGALAAIAALLAVKQVSTIWAEKTAGALARAAPVPGAPVKSVATRQAPAKIDLPAYDITVFKRHLKTRFPRYQKLFKQAAARHRVDWDLLAAQAYQESHWNRKAKSPTGVRGIMMLTRRTAASLGVTNRLDPVQSINGGAKYLSRLEGRLPKKISHPDRTFVALAAYNVGLGHVKDAQTLARRHGKDPHQWQHLRSVLPLLTKKRYYKTVRYGYARGHEPVQYVKRIRTYRLLLERHT